jgi:hypothetical protein
MLKSDKWVIGICAGLLAIASPSGFDKFHQWQESRLAQQTQCLENQSKIEAMRAAKPGTNAVHVLLSAESIAQLAQDDCHLSTDSHDEALRQAAAAVAWAETPP